MDAHFIEKGVDLAALPLVRLNNVLENYYIEQQVANLRPEEQQKARDTLRAQFMRYNGEDVVNGQTSTGTGNDENTYPDSDLEPTEEGGYPGLESGFLGG